MTGLPTGGQAPTLRAENLSRLVRGEGVRLQNTPHVSMAGNSVSILSLSYSNRSIRMRGWNRRVVAGGVAQRASVRATGRRPEPHRSVLCRAWIGAPTVLLSSIAMMS